MRSVWFDGKKLYCLNRVPSPCLFNTIAQEIFVSILTIPYPVYGNRQRKTPVVKVKSIHDLVVVVPRCCIFQGAGKSVRIGPFEVDNTTIILIEICVLLWIVEGVLVVCNNLPGIGQGPTGVPASAYQTPPRNEESLPCGTRWYGSLMALEGPTIKSRSSTGGPIFKAAG